MTVRIEASHADETVRWLLEGDPAVRWQTMEALTGADPREVAAERRRVEVEGWGARLLALQDADGRWAGALYSPKWTSTTYTLLLLQRLGLPAGDAQALRGCRAVWEGARELGGGLTLAASSRQAETCITGMLVLLASSFGHADPRLPAVVEWLLGQQLADGGWNCESLRSGSQHGSFHTTITVLEALTAHRAEGGAVPIDAAAAAGREFFLRHALYRSHRSGAVVDRAFTRFPFPPQWHFDVVRGLEHFREAQAHRDPRLADAVELVRAGAGADGRWPKQPVHPGRYWFSLEGRGRSRWATLRALRVLRWWDERPGQSDGR